jgi:predicted O-methyltransferase YrrM
MRLRNAARADMEGADFLLLKERAAVDRYVQIVDELHPQNIFELGIFGGGSTALLSELARPRAMVAVDMQPPTSPALREYVQRRGLHQVIQIHDNVDQADRGRLAEIAEEAFGDQRLDLVVDDCSHMYEATRASFNELFPRLRPGGLYTIEDWTWDRDPQIAEVWADEVPLKRLACDLVLAVATGSGVIAELSMTDDLIEVRRGGADIAPRTFELLSS